MIVAVVGIAFAVGSNSLFASVAIVVAVGDAFATLVGFTRFKLVIRHLRFCFFEHLVIV